VSRKDNKLAREEPWKSLSEAGLVEISIDQFPERVKQAKRVVMGRLSELLDPEVDTKERQSVAHSLGTLQKLEMTLRVEAGPPRDPADQGK
jgi:hypothetical protein